jgi:uncharacterized protein (TIGR03067 family)
MRPSLFVAIAGCLLIGADGPPAATDADAALLGTWRVVGMRIAGKALEEAEFAGGKWVITADKIKTIDAQVEAVYLHKLDASKKPKQIDMKLLEGRDVKSETQIKITGAEAETAKGIYFLEGDTLTVCLGLDERPTDVNAKAGSEGLLYTLKKQKK